MKAPLVALLVLLLVAPAEARLLDDAEGDQVWTATGGAFSGEQQGDLVGLDVEEVPEGFWFHCVFATLQGDLEDVETHGSSVVIPLTFGGVEYRVALGKGPASVTYYQGSIVRVEPDGSTTPVRYADTFAGEAVRADVDEGSISFFVQRDELRAADGKVPATGDKLVLGQVRGLVRIDPTMGSAPPQEILDLMPDAEATADVRVMLGPQQTTLRVTGDDAFRRSNGAATTYRFDFLVSNMGAKQRFAAVLEGLPAKWEARAVPSAFDLAAGSNRTVSVYVSTPFGHQHGGVDAAALAIRGMEDANAFGGALFGIRYLPTPQPAGHHHTLFLHSTKTSTGRQQEVQQAIIPDHPRSPLYMNTLGEDDADTLEPVLPSLGFADLEDPQAAGRLLWLAPLAPELGIGLAFQPGGTGGIEARIQGGAPLGPATITSRVVLAGTNGTDDTRQQHPIQNRGVTDVLRADAQQVDLDGSTLDYKAILIPTPAATTFPFADGVDLVLEIQVELAHPAGLLSPTLPTLAPGAFLDLPLLEYADALPAGALSGGVRIDLRPAVRDANPGDTLVWPIVTDPATAGLEAFGAKELGLRIADAKEGRFLILHVPDDALDLDLIPVHVLASAGAEQGSALVNVRVTTGADVPDDQAQAAGLLAKDEESPGLPGLLVLATVLAVALARRRHGA